MYFENTYKTKYIIYVNSISSNSNSINAEVLLANSNYFKWIYLDSYEITITLEQAMKFHRKNRGVHLLFL